MVTGEKPDETVDWGEVNEFLSSELATEALREASMSVALGPLQIAVDRLASAVFGFTMSEAPDWFRELGELETAHEVSGLRGRERRRLASLRARARRAMRLAGRAAQREAIGLGGGCYGV